MADRSELEELIHQDKEMTTIEKEEIIMVMIDIDFR